MPYLCRSGLLHKLELYIIKQLIIWSNGIQSNAEQSSRNILEAF